MVDSHREVVSRARHFYLYAMEVLRGPFPLGEAAITRDALYSYLYARDVIKGPFPLGEAAIATDLGCSYSYAFRVLKEPFPLGEKTIAKDEYFSYLYALDVIKGPFPLGEAAIAKDAWYSYEYAKDVLKGPFPEGEKAITRHTIPLAVWDYCFNIAKQRTKNIEPTFAKHPGLALSYAIDILKEPFPMGEEAILKSPRIARRYKKFLDDKLTNSAML